MELNGWQPDVGAVRIEKLDAGAVGEIEALIAPTLDTTEAIDAFSAEQVDAGTFFGVRNPAGSLVSFAGTHLVSQKRDIGCLGNVYTHPDSCGRGYARAATSAVIAALKQSKIGTIVLNVRKENKAAQRIYSRLGFQPYCEFFEGFAVTR